MKCVYVCMKCVYICVYVCVCMQVVVGDRVILMPVQAKQPLHLSRDGIPQRMTCNEVNALNSPVTNWRICLFEEYREDTNAYLKAVS